MHSAGQGDVAKSPFVAEGPATRGRAAVALRTEIPPKELLLLGGAQSRIVYAMLVIGVVGSVAGLVWRGWDWGAGFAAGAAVSILNFHWLKSAANLLADAFATRSGQQVPSSSSTPRKTWVVVRFMLRYALLGLSGYVIFLSSLVSLGAFLAGLFVLVGGLMVEAGYEVIYEFKSSAGKT
jgi:hypothetical protein